MKPILFNTDMVKAILDDRKTMTRRAIKPHHKEACGFYVTHRLSDGAFMGVYDYDEYETMFDSPQRLPYQVGNILYVRETWAKISDWVDIDPSVGIFDGFIYRADWEDKEEHPRWRPSIHMPKEAARIFLRVTDVRVERLQEITIEDTLKEGCKEERIESLKRQIPVPPFEEDTPYRIAYSEVWNSTLKKLDFDPYSWEANPWVWVIEFERISKEEAYGEL